MRPARSLSFLPIISHSLADLILLAGPWPDRSGSCSRRWSGGWCIFLPPLLCWDTEFRTRQKLPPSSTSPRHSSQTFKQLCSILAAYRGEGRALREGERTGTQTQAARSWEAKSEAPSVSKGRTHSPSVPSHFSSFLLCTLKKSVLQ